MTKEDKAKVLACFGASPKDLAKKTGIQHSSLLKRIRQWLAGTRSADRVLTPSRAKRHRQYDFDIEIKAEEIGISACQLHARLQQVETGTRTLAEALAPHRLDINTGLSAAQLAKLKPRVGTWEQQNL